uniref:Uncharacterized protein n=1 Tax=Junco hyemalis TaxID=40217 RepID=A0A8C5IA87_JUNHY
FSILVLLATPPLCSLLRVSLWLHGSPNPQGSAPHSQQDRLFPGWKTMGANPPGAKARIDFSCVLRNPQCSPMAAQTTSQNQR